MIKQASIRLNLAASDLRLKVQDLQFEYQMAQLTSPLQGTELYLLKKEKLLNAVASKAQEASLIYLVIDESGSPIAGSVKDPNSFFSRVVREKIIEVPEFSFIIYLGIPREELKKALRQGLFYYAFSVVIGTVLILLAGYSVYFLWIREPLTQVVEALEKGQELRLCGLKELDLLVKSIREALKREKELMQKLNFTEKMSALGVLAGGYAHEFNNLLQIICGSLDISEHFIQQGEAEKALKSLERAKKAALKGKEISGRILGLGRRKPSSRGSFLRPTVIQALESIRSGLSARVKLSWEESDKDFYTPLSEEEWQEILFNLILNARDAILAKDIEDGEIKVRLVEKDELVGVEVEDNGCGIPEEIRTRIFEPFFTTKEPGKGTGLGLYLIHRLVTEIGGRMELESTPGKGTVVRVLVPRIEAPKEEAPETSKTKPVVKALKAQILVVDDEEDLRNNLVDLLNLWNYKAEGASSVEEALEKLQKKDYQILLVDLFMPGKNGLHLIKALPEEFSGKVILITGFTGELEEKIQEFLKNGRIRTLLRKPFSSEEVKKIIQEVLLC